MKAPFKINNVNKLTEWRYNSFWTKEPETLAFIRDFGKHFEPNRPSVFFDIGANIGIYSLYAASLYSKLIIIAIEPQIDNYMALIQNIKLNHFPNIIPLNLAISSECGTRLFRAPNNEIGNSTGQIIDNGKNKKDNNDQEIFTFDIEVLINVLKYRYIDFIKIDVDGAEFDIIFGMRNVLGKAISMMIEMNKENRKYEVAKKYIEKFGYTTDNDFNKLHNHSRVRRTEEGNKNIENIIFVKI